MKAPIDTYFVDCSGVIGPFMHAKRAGYQFAPNIQFLGRYGVKEINKLKVAYISGLDASPQTANELKLKDYEGQYTGNTFVQNDVENLLKLCKDDNIDLLITCAWPQDVLKLTSQRI